MNLLTYSITLSLVPRLELYRKGCHRSNPDGFYRVPHWDRMVPHHGDLYYSFYVRADLPRRDGLFMFSPVSTIHNMLLDSIVAQHRYIPYHLHGVYHPSGQGVAAQFYKDHALELDMYMCLDFSSIHLRHEMLVLQFMSVDI